jgi:uncharacterized protein YyaL (SSP411 family)
MRRAVSGKPDVLECAPHFERMLYDNAQLARVYFHAWQATGDEIFRTITEEILNYVAREMLDPAGVQMLHAQHLPSSSSSAGTAGFYSTQDADSEGEEGQELAETMLQHFGDSQGALYDTSDDHEALITRPRDLQDNATLSGNAMAVSALLKLAGFTNEVRHVDVTHQALPQMQPMMSQYPLGFGQWLQALAYALSKPREIAIIGDPDSADTQALLSVVGDGYRPFQVVALGAPGRGVPTVPLLDNRDPVDGQPTAYVCRDFACQALVPEAEELRALLETG